MITWYGLLASSSPKETNSTKSGTGGMSCNGQPWPPVSTSVPAARGRLKQEDPWLLSQDNRHLPTTLLGESANRMVLRVGPQTSNISIH